MPGPSWGSPTGQGPAVTTVGFVSDTPATSSGASAAGNIRERPETPPAPRPWSRHRSHWWHFVYWCEERRVNFWPASPETVSTYLVDRARTVSGATLETARTAIRQTLRGAGLADPCADDIVKATLSGLLVAKGKSRSPCSVISGSSLEAAELDAIRSGVLALRPRRVGVEADERARKGELVDLALCSLVLEAGLQCRQVAVLEWRDLGVNDKQAETITIRTGRADAGDAIRISERAYDDLDALSRESLQTDQKIFNLDTRRISERIRAAARAAELESRVEAAGPLPSARAGTGNTKKDTARVRDSRWRIFCDWCDAHGVNKLPAGVATVAEYFREESKSKSNATMLAKRDAIAHAHLTAGHADPCPRGLARSAPQGFRSRTLCPSRLDPDIIRAIRATALVPRPRGAGMETQSLARYRGLVDIALCSVQYEAQLTTDQMEELTWRDVQRHENRVWLTVRCGGAAQDRTEVREITGQPDSDLAAMPRRGEPGESVFGLSNSTIYRRVKEAMRVASCALTPAPNSPHTSA